MNSPSQTAERLSIDIDRLQSELEKLATMSDCPEPPPAVTRVVFTEKDIEARAYLRGLYEEAGLEVRVDSIGNTFARWVGSEPKTGAVGTGSHTDAIPHAGLYDGTVGVLGGLEAIRALKQTGYQPRRSIEVVMFTSEEPTRFGVGCTGSRTMAGLFGEKELTNLHDSDGVSYDEVRLAAGFSGSLDDVRLPEGYYDAWVELHIEQGPELEAADLPIGIVTAIAAPATMVYILHGEGGHAGGVLMPRRKDALCAAAEIITAVERFALESRSPDLVATVGELDVHPGAVNSIPSRVRLTLDLRDIDGENRNTVLKVIGEEVARIAQRRGVTIDEELLNADPPAVCGEAIVSAVERSAAQLGHASQRMVSRAYHDSLFIDRIAPVGMIFIPCRGGVSHRPDEYSTPEQIRAGVETLALTLAELAS